MKFSISRIEPQVIDYQTQQYRLLPGLATTYAFFFASNQLSSMLSSHRDASQNFSKSSATDLGKVFITLFLRIKFIID